VAVTVSTQLVIRQHRFDRTECSGRHWIGKVNASTCLRQNCSYSFAIVCLSWEEWVKIVAVFCIEDGGS